MKFAQRLGQLLALGFWIAVAVAAAGLLPDLATRMLLIAGAAIFVMHGVQLLVFRRALACYSRNKLKDALLVLLFGIFHLAALMPRAGQQPSASDAQ